eukprot:g882.t1
MGKKIRPNVLTNEQPKKRRNEKRRTKNQHAFVNVPLPVPDGGSSDEANSLSEEDIKFVKKYSDKLSFLAKIEQDELDQQVLHKQQMDIDRTEKISQNRLESNEEPISEDEELDKLDQDHARMQGDDQSQIQTRSEKQIVQLPLKTADGRIVLKEELTSEATDLARRVEGVTVDDAFVEGSESEEEEPIEMEETKLPDKEMLLETTVDEQVEIPILKNESYEEDQSMEGIKTTIALCANEMLVKSEKSVAPLRRLLSLCRNKDPQVSHLALLSCMKVFKDIIPGYKIQDDSNSTGPQFRNKLEKEGLRRKEYEALLLRCYQSYLKILLETSRSRVASITTLRICVKCFCGLAESLHSFNYGTDLIKSVVNWMRNSDPMIRENCCKCVSQIIKADSDGHRSLEVVQYIGDLIKRQKCSSHPMIVKSLLNLSFPDITLPTKEDKKIKKTSKNKRRKMFKIRDEMEKQGKEFDVYQMPYDKTLHDKSEIQTRIIEALFEVFFRVIKHCSHHTHSRSIHENDASVHAFIQKKCPLLAVSLRGLGKYAHVMSVEYFEDVLKVITKLLSCESLPFYERFQCLLAISEILRGQGEALNIDRKEFYQQLYWSVSHWRLDQIKEIPQFTEHEEILLIEVCHQMLCETKTTDFSRLAAFVKRLLALGLHQETGVSMGICFIVNRLLIKYRRLRALMDSESETPIGGACYDDSTLDPSQAGGLLTTLWELSLLQKHFNPHLSQGVGQMMKIKADGLNNDLNCLLNGVFASTIGPTEIVQKYSMQNGTFWPYPSLKKLKKRKFGELTLVLDGEYTDGLHLGEDHEIEEAFQQQFRFHRRQKSLTNIRHLMHC